MLYLIGNSHIDPVWLWEWREGSAEIRATFRSALDRLREFDEFVFTSSSAAYYEWVEQVDPAMFEEIRVRVKEGRWVLCGGWWVQPDCNTPCGESFIRQGLTAQRYFHEKFGVTADVGYCPDSFGHNGALPQILKKSGMRAYLFMRPSPAENPNLPSLFFWKGNDGTKIPAFRITGSYNHSGPGLSDAIRAQYASASKAGEDRMFFFGVGNHGGGPTVRNLLDICSLKKEGLRIAISSPPAYFAKAVPKQTVSGSLLHHSIGCYSANSRVKGLNQRAEQRLLETESLCVLAHSLAGIDYPARALRKAWKKTLFNQFHDILSGCCMERAYDGVTADFGYVLSECADLENRAIQSIACRVDTVDGHRPPREKTEGWYWKDEKLGTPVLIFNSLDRPLTAPVSLNMPVAKLLDSEGKEVPTQKIHKEFINYNLKRGCFFLADLPALGYQLYRAFPVGSGEDQNTLKTPEERDSHVLENRHFRAEVSNRTGSLRSFFDKRLNRELLSRPARMAVLDDSANDTWAHGAVKFDKVCGEAACAKAARLEDGPLRTVVRTVSGYGSSTVRQDYIMYPDDGALHLELFVNWQETQKILRLELPVAVTGAPSLTHALPFGYEEKPCDGREQPVGLWCALGGADAGLTVVQQGIFSGMAKGSTLGITILRSAYYGHHTSRADGFLHAMDQGEHKFHLAFFAHSGKSRPAAARLLADRLLRPPVVLLEGYHNGKLPVCCSGISVSPATIRISALKGAEDGDGVVVRLEELDGTACEARVRLPGRTETIPVRLMPYEIKTLRVLQSGEIHECQMIE